jgi:hypothetical protein
VTGPWARRFSGKTRANFLKSTQWRCYQALEAPGQAACVALTTIAYSQSRPLEVPQPLTPKIPQNPKWVTGTLGRLAKLDFLIFLDVNFTVNPINHNLLGVENFIAI